MTVFVQTAPRRGESVLHVAGCSRIHRLVGTVSMESWDDQWDKNCPACITPALDGEAYDQRKAWQEEERRLADLRVAAYRELELKRQADMYESMHHWLPIRDYLSARFEAVDMRVYRDGSSDWKDAPIFEFRTGWPVRTCGAEVRMTSDLKVDRISGVYVATAADAVALAEVLVALECNIDEILSGARR